MLLAVAAPTENNSDRTVLDKHLATYTAKNSFDYFIHKDLGGFLRRELDLYLKTDVLNLDDLAAGDTLRLQRALARTRAVRHVADKIITFLAQIEDFQKQLMAQEEIRVGNAILRHAGPGAGNPLPGDCGQQFATR